MNNGCTAAYLEAEQAGRATYPGKPCRHGHSGERFTEDRSCVECRAEGRTTDNSTLYSRVDNPEGPLAKAQLAWIELQKQHPQRPKHRLWGLFLDSIKDDQPVYRAALDHMDRPQPPKPKQQRGFHEALGAWALSHGVYEIEARVREAIANGHYNSASKLRHEALALMRQGSAQVARTMLAAVSSS